MSKKNIYSWNIQKKNDFIKNQNVSININNNYICVTPNQTISTPGIKINKKFSIFKNKVYVLEVTGYSNRKNSAFIWAIDNKNKRLIKNYSYLKTEETNICEGFKLNYDTNIEIGVLFTEPTNNDKLCVKNIYLYELIDIDNKNYNNTEQTYNTEQNCNIEQTYNIEQNCNIEQTYNTEQNIKIDNTSCYDTSSDICSSITEPANEYNPIKYSSGGCPYSKGHLNVYNKYEFCKLFNITSQKYSIESLIKFTESNDCDDIKYNYNIPAGYTFFGQFVAHDLSFNLDKFIIDKNINSNNYRTPHFDLDNLYGPKDNKYLYSNNKFIINKKHDLNRNKDGIAIIPDSRNDENYVVAQLHLLFQLFHNKLVNKYKKENVENVFEYVKKEVTFYYQWIIVNDFLPKLIDNSILDSIFKYGTKFFDSKKSNNCIPIEFSVAAFRYGHFTVRDEYLISNDYKMNQNDIHKFTKGCLPNLIIDWNNFFHVTDTTVPQPSKSIDTNISKNLQNMVHINTPKDFPYNKNNLLLRNLLRSQQQCIASGQDIAKLMGLNPIPIELLRKYDINKGLEDNNLIDNTPLLLYILMESKIYKNGEQLTGVGGILVAEVILSFLFNDPNSYFNSSEKWFPCLPSKEEGQFLFGDLIRYIYS